MLSATDSDIALLNSGTLRSDRVHPRGNFKLKDLLSILPLVDPVVVLEITGKSLNKNVFKILLQICYTCYIFQ